MNEGMCLFKSARLLIFIINHLKNNCMGTCSSAPHSNKKIRKDKPTHFNRKIITSSLPSNKKRPNKMHSLPPPSQQTNDNQGNKSRSTSSFTLSACMGVIIGQSLDYRLQMTKEKIGLGCLVSKSLFLASDHYLYGFQCTEIRFCPLQSSEEIKVKKCIYPYEMGRTKKRSTYLHKRLGMALYELEQQVGWASCLQLGINILGEDCQRSLQEELMVEDLIDQSREYIGSQGLPQLPRERGWPLIYKLYGNYYCIGLYSSPYTSDYVLLNEKSVLRLQSAQEKHCGTNQIGYLQIDESLVNVAVVNKQRTVLQGLVKQLQVVQRQGNKIEQAFILFSIGLQYGYLGNLKQEKQYYQRALQLYKAAPLDQNVAALLHNIAVCESEAGQYQKAENYLVQALQMKRSFDKHQHESIGDSYNQLGTICKKMNRVEQSLHYYEKALKIYQENSVEEKIAMAINNINLIKEQESTYSVNTAKYMHSLRLLVKNKTENCLEVATIYFNLARVQSDCKNYGNSLNYLSKSFNIIKNLKLQSHSFYRVLLRYTEQVHELVLQYGQKREWQLKSTALMELTKEDRPKCS